MRSDPDVAACAGLIERLERALVFGAKRLAVPVDVGDVTAMLDLLKRLQGGAHA